MKPTMYCNGQGSEYKMIRNADGTYKVELRYSCKLVKRLGGNWHGFTYDEAAATIVSDSVTEYPDNHDQFKWW